MPRRLVKLPFPIRGLHAGESDAQQPPLFCTDCLNVRPFDTIGGRKRGGKRPGLAKVLNQALAGRVDKILQGTVASDPNLDEVPSELSSQYSTPPTGATRFTPNGQTLFIGNRAYSWPGFSAASTPLDTTTGNNVYPNPSGDRVAVADVPNSKVWVRGWSDLSGFTLVEDSSVTASDCRHAAWHPSETHIAVTRGSTSPNVQIFPIDGSGVLGSALSNPATLPGICDETAWHPSGDWLACAAGGGVKVYPFTGSAWGVLLSNPGDMPSGQCDSVAWSSDGNYLILGIENSPYLVVYQWSGGFGSRVSVPTPSRPTSRNDIKQVVVSGDYIALAMDTWSTSSPTQAFPYLLMFPFQDGVVGDAIEPDSAPNGGTSSGLARYGAAFHPTESYLVVHDLVYEVGYTEPEAKTRANYLVAVANGNVYQSSDGIESLDIATSGTAALEATPFMAAIATADTVYFADGTQYKKLDLDTSTVSDWTATAGSLPVDANGKRARIGCLWRGRIVLSGLTDDSQNWFMSAVNDPGDWDYSPANTTPTQAVAGNASDAGLVGDRVTALVPFSDDFLLIGGDHSIWIMNGDPADGGSIDNVSRSIGIVGPEAWCHHPDGSIFFVSYDGLHRMSPGSQPVNMSLDRLPRSFGWLNPLTRMVRLLWDIQRHGLHIFLSPIVERASIHLFWDERTDSFWVDQFPTAYGPSAVWTYDDDDPDKALPILGGYDGYLRFMSSANDDDGEEITSRVNFQPLVANPGDRLILRRMVLVTDSASDSDTEIRCYTGDTAEAAVEASKTNATPLFRTTVPPGRPKNILQRAGAPAIALQVWHRASDAGWAFEELAIDLDMPQYARPS